MRITFTLLTLSLLALVGCSTSHSPHSHTKPGNPPMIDSPETVLVTYHVKVGMEPVFEHQLSLAWDAYRKEHLVMSEPHVIVRESEEGNTSGYIEIFTWVSHAAPGKASPEIQQIWSQEHSLCEARGGRQALGGGEVELLVPAHK